jgi:hypothetical protein
MKDKSIFVFPALLVAWLAWMVAMTLSPSLHEGQVVSIPGVVDRAIVSDVASMAPIGPTRYYCDYELNGRRHDAFNRWELRKVAAPASVSEANRPNPNQE